METMTIPTDFTESQTISAERVTLTIGTYYADDRGQRRYWHYYIVVDGDVAHEGDDLSGYGNANTMMETFTGFLSAWAESVEWADRNGRSDGENTDLFPMALYARIGHEVDDLVMMGMDLVACDTCGGGGRWLTTLEESPTVLTDLGPCPDCV
jgi:hypothetical protein